ncbi:MAG: hypothetical protein P8Z68_11110, partial [Kineosporiaceae bacterium]
MKRVTTGDRDRALRVLSVVTGSITAGSLAATGVFTVLAARESQRDDALQVGSDTTTGSDLPDTGQTGSEDPTTPDGT